MEGISHVILVTVPAFALKFQGKPGKACEDKRYPGRDLNLGPPEYEAGFLIT
jgi:hypothetical protein